MESKEIVHQMLMDQETIKALESKSDDPNQVHRLEHHFICTRIEPLMDLVRVCLELGFLETSIDEMNDDPDGRYYFTDLISESKIDYAKICRETLLMTALAETFGCEYDGWGTEVRR